MDNAGYVTLTRQSGLMREMQIVANNIANISTAGFRAEGITFGEYIKTTGANEPSLSMALSNVRHVVERQGGMARTDGRFDLAIEGEGYFLIQTPNGERLTRAGQFTPSGEGTLVTADGHPVLDAGGSPVFVPPGGASVSIAGDGTMSVDGVPVGQIGLVTPIDRTTMTREGGTMFATDGYEPTLGARVVQGFVEQSNVNPVVEIARMIEVQRAYEMGQSFMSLEDQRVRDVVEKLK